MDRVILHSDLNNFYASVECRKRPELRHVPVAVCGDPEARHGIVLAKNQLAKVAGVKTGEAIWQAKQKCPGLVVVPPHMEEYVAVSKEIRAIYGEYTDQVEPFGIDECWLDVGNSCWKFGDGLTIAHEIRNRVKKEMDVTVSVGVSFCKTLAKLGSDLKKPDAVTTLYREEYHRKIDHLPVDSLIFAGRSTRARLNRCGIMTLGQLGAADPAFLKSILGVNGVKLWRCVNGLENDRVLRPWEEETAKSVGHGITCVADLTRDEEIKGVLRALSEDVARRLRRYRLMAQAVAVDLRDNELIRRSYMQNLPFRTQSSRELSDAGFQLYQKNGGTGRPIRSLGIRAIKLVSEDEPEQLTLLSGTGSNPKQERLERTIEKLKERYGSRAVEPAILMQDLKLPAGGHHHVVTLPTGRADIREEGNTMLWQALKENPSTPEYYQ